MQLGYIGIPRFDAHLLYIQKPVGNKSVAMLIWCERDEGIRQPRAVFGLLEFGQL